MSAISITVGGTPAPQGSKTAFRTKNGKVNLVESSHRVYEWRKKVKEEAARVVSETGWQVPEKTEGVVINLEFNLPATQAQKKAFNASGTDPGAHVQRPDLDKLIRAVLDAITGVVIADDSQVVKMWASKKRVFYNTGVRIFVDMERED